METQRRLYKPRPGTDSCLELSAELNLPKILTSTCQQCDRALAVTEGTHTCGHILDPPSGCGYLRGILYPRWGSALAEVTQTALPWCTVVSSSE